MLARSRPIYYGIIFPMSRLVVAPNHREMPCSCLSQNDNSPRRAQGDVGCKSTFGQDIERSWSKTGCRLWRLEHVVVLVGMSFNRVIVCHDGLVVVVVVVVVVPESGPGRQTTV